MSHPFMSVKLRPPSWFNVWRFELMLLLVAICVRLVYWMFNANGHILATLLGTYIVGNMAILLILASRPMFQKRPPPWNWIGYLILLFLLGIFANFLAEIPIYLLFVPRSVPFERAFLNDAPFSMLVTLIFGILVFVFDDSRTQLEARNQQLQRQVQLGLMERRTHLSELEQAGEIQMHLLPRDTPQLPGFQIACAWQPASSVSGDYFDVFSLGADKLALCLADVSGKGMAAALLMANLQASVKAFAQDNPSPGAMCARLNTALSDNIAPGRFVTLFYGVLDAKTRMLRYENAGHCLPLLVHADGSVEFPAAYSGVLGLFSHWTYSDREQPLLPGDVLLLLTDGVLEASNAEEEEFGYQRVISSVLASRGSGAHGIRKQLLEDVTAFCEGHFQDDASLIVVSVQ